MWKWNVLISLRRELNSIDFVLFAFSVCLLLLRYFFSLFEERQERVWSLRGHDIYTRTVSTTPTTLMDVSEISTQRYILV